jgi:hypothetical protein
MGELDHEGLTSALRYIVHSYPDDMGPYSEILVGKLVEAYFKYKKNHREFQAKFSSNDNLLKTCHEEGFD